MLRQVLRLESILYFNLRFIRLPVELGVVFAGFSKELCFKQGMTQGYDFYKSNTFLLCVGGAYSLLHVGGQRDLGSFANSFTS